MRISNLQSEASSMKQGDSTVTEFFIKLRIIWDEINNFRPDPVCSCTKKCSCGMIDLISQRKSEDQVMQFLRGLNEQYTNVRCHVLLLEHVPHISKIFSYVIQQERQIMSNSFHSETDIKINANNAQITCNYCGKGGHIKFVCFKKNGFPSNHDEKYSRNCTKRTCTHRGKKGHIVDVCYRKHGFLPGHKFLNSKANYVKTNENKHEEKKDNTSGE